MENINKQNETVQEPVGPLLSDREFIETLNCDRYPELSACGEALDKNDPEGARKTFADCVRGIFDKEKFFTLPSREKKPALTDSLKATAERALRHEMVSCGTPMKFEGKVDWFANPTFNQYREWPFQLSRHNELVQLARAYRACGDQRYANGCAELLDSWIKQAVRPDYTLTGYGTLCWRTIECGIRMGLMWPEIIHTFCDNKEAFTDALIFDFFKSVYEHSQRMLNAFTMGNWLMHELNGLAQNGIFYPVFKDAESWIAIAMSKMEEELREKQVYADGFQFESSTGYHGVVLTHVMEIIEVAEEYGTKIPKSMYGAVENMLSLYVKLMQANGKMPHPNDGGGADCASTVRRYMKYFPENEQFKWVATGGAEGRIPDYGSILLEYCGHYAMRRSDWGGGVSVFFDAGVYGRAHQHEDKLNLTVCNSSRPILCEANTYAYDSSEERKYCLASAGHNVILVNGMGQNRRASYKWDTSMLFEKAENVALTVTRELDTAVGVYDGEYGEERLKPASHKRTVMLLKNPKKGAPSVIVVDEMTADSVNEYEAVWHFDTANAAVNGGKFVSDDITQFICGDLGETEIVCGRKEPSLQGWICRRSLQGSAEPIPTLLHRLKGRNTRTVNVFSLHGTEGSPISSVSLDGDMLTISYDGGEKNEISLY